MINDNQPYDYSTTELKEIKTPTLYVNVDFNQLLNDHNEQKTFELLGKLKDLLS